MRSVDSGKRPLGRPPPCPRWAPTVTIDVSRVVESVRDHEMPRQPVSKKDRADRQSILESRGHTLTELATVQRDPTLYRKVLTKATEDCHRRVLESFWAYLATLTPSQLALYPGSPKSAEDILKPGGQIDSGHLHAWLLHKAVTAMNEDNAGHQQQGDRREGERSFATDYQADRYRGSHLSHSVNLEKKVRVRARDITPLQSADACAQPSHGDAAVPEHIFDAGSTTDDDLDDDISDASGMSAGDLIAHRRPREEADDEDPPSQRHGVHLGFQTPNQLEHPRRDDHVRPELCTVPTSEARRHRKHQKGHHHPRR